MLAQIVLQNKENQSSTTEANGKNPISFQVWDQTKNQTHLEKASQTSPMLPLNPAEKRLLFGGGRDELGFHNAFTFYSVKYC